MAAVSVGTVAKLVGRYAVAIVIGAGLVWRFLRVSPSHATPLMFLLGGAIGVVAMAAVDIRINARYMLANHAEAKRRRRRDAQRKTSGSA
jgi:hypothetical protein